MSSSLGSSSLGSSGLGSSALGGSSGSAAVAGAWPAALPVPLIGRTHRIMPRSEVTTMETKRMRARPKHELLYEVIAAQWRFTVDEFDSFKAYFENVLENGSLAFTMVTYEPSPDPTLIRTVERELVFMDGRYDFRGSDNLFEVSGELLIESETVTEIVNPNAAQIATPPIETTGTLTVEQNESADEIVLTWDNMGVNRYIIQISETPDGPWEDLITTRWFGVGEERTVTISNEWDGDRYFRVLSIVGSVLATITFGGQTNVVQPVAPCLAMPTLESWTNLLPVGDLSLTPTNRPVPALLVHGDLVAENPEDEIASFERQTLLVNNATYGSVRGRKEVEFSGLSLTSGVVTLTFTHPDPSAEIRFTSDGTQPTLASLANGSDANVGNYATFGRIIRARAFKGACKSPEFLLLIDTNHSIIPNLGGTGHQVATSSACDDPGCIPVPDVSGCCGSNGCYLWDEDASGVGWECNRLAADGTTLKLWSVIDEYAWNASSDPLGKLGVSGQDQGGSPCDVHTASTDVRGIDTVEFSRSASWDTMYDPLHNWIGYEIVRGPTAIHASTVSEKRVELMAVSQISGADGSATGITEKLTAACRPFGQYKSHEPFGCPGGIPQPTWLKEAFIITTLLVTDFSDE